MDDKSGRMEWILDVAEKYRAQIRRGPFFQSLEQIERVNDIKWVHQLIHQSREFTQALCLRYSLCHDKRYQRIFAEHAVEEADHPDQLIAWMAKYGFLSDVEGGAIPATRETIDSLAYCWRSAVHEPHDVQVIVLNVLSEGIALDFYTAVIPVLKRLDILSGRYWNIHREVDSRHLRMGLDLCGNVPSDSPTGMHYQRVLAHAASLYHQMLSSWVGKRGEPLER
ncbi:iron-containing redox enzyme family protein [Pendulispora rubella]|uniref:Iron-containing redox enzyme family protein n=1 Tax=Pendulispora rubella TaxID=2741070 RepID=A0ABZ2LCT1_9BACT